MEKNGDPDPKQHYTHIFNQVAQVYDEYGPHYFKIYGKRLAELAQIPTGARILDLATGTGAVLHPASQAAGQPGFTIGIDLAAQMLARTASELCQNTEFQIALAQMDAEHLAFQDSAFDQILCGFAMFFLPEPYKAAAEIMRVMKPAGIFAFSTWGQEEDPNWDWLDDLVKAYLPPKEEKGAEESEDRIDFHDPDPVRAFLEGSGFREVIVVSEQMEVVLHDAGEWWSVLNSHGGLELVEAVRNRHGEDGLNRFKNEVFQHIREFQRSDGVPIRHHVIYFIAKKAYGE